MKSRSWGILLLSALSALGVALAPGGIAEAKPSKRKQKMRAQLETYPAIEDMEIAAEATPSEIRVSRFDSSAVVITEGLDSLARNRALEERVQLLEKRLSERSLTERPKAPATTAGAPVAGATAAPSFTAPTPREFEQVPADKTDMIATRIRLVEEILRESGRAYDYRTQTTAQLRQILQTLRNDQRETAKILAE